MKSLAALSTTAQRLVTNLYSTRTGIRNRTANSELVYIADGLSRSIVGRPTRLLDSRRLSFSSTEARLVSDPGIFSPHPQVAVILTLGQSQMGNEGDPHGLYSPGPGVYNFNFFDGVCYVARDPLLGTTFNRSNFATRLGDYLVSRSVFERVLLVPVAHGGTFISEWIPGSEMYPRIVVALRRLRDLGIEVTHVLWQQGETDAAYAIDATSWMRHFSQLVSALRRLGLSAPIFVAQSTRCCGPPSDPIRAAQRGVVDPNNGVFSGPDTDPIGPEYRWDGCHFSTDGLSQVAELWFTTLAAYNRNHRQAS